MAAMLKCIRIVQAQRTRNRRRSGKAAQANTTKIHLVVDNYGLPAELEITGGEVNDCSAAPDLIARLPDAEVIVTDKGYDSGVYTGADNEEGSQKVVIPKKVQFSKG
jgi:hypothetical protein